MRHENYVVFLLVIALFSTTRGQDTTETSTVTLSTSSTTTTSTTTSTTTTTTTTSWHGDPKLCPDDPGPAPTRTAPEFAAIAEFALEQVEYERLGPTGIPGHRIMQQHIFDYNANKVIIVKNMNGLIISEYYYYEKQEKSVYLGREYCAIQPINIENDIDGTSAVQWKNGTWHVRPLNEYLLFSNLDPDRRIIKPRFIEETTVRGIPVEVWSSCYVVQNEFRTVRRLWSIARNGTIFPSGIVVNKAVPIQAVIQATISLPNGTEIAEADEILNIFDYKEGVQESASDLSPPKGVFCSGGNISNLATLAELGIAWPDRFSIRVETSTTRLSKYERFHLRYDSGRNSGSSRRIRYDFLPSGAEDFRSVIHDYGENLTYTIDRRLGSCQVDRIFHNQDFSPLRNPIEFFIKHERHTISHRPIPIWQNNGLRSCRGSTIKCTVVTAEIDNFPPIVDSDTGLPTGDTWLTTNIEYAWSIRAPFASQPGGPLFDYPVSLFMKMYRYRDPLNKDPTTIISENVEYEFYELSEDRSPYDFDISTCYRSNRWEYFHVYFSIKINKDNVIDGDKISITSLDTHVIRTIVEKSKISRWHRIADLEIEHESVGNTLNVFFTMLGQTRIPETGSFNMSEPTAADAIEDLKSSINNGDFKFTMNLTDLTTVEFTAEKDSLHKSSEYMSTHTRGTVVTVEEYSSSGQAVAIVVGLLVGLIIGALLIIIIRVIRKERVPFVPTSMTNPTPSVNYSARKNNASTDA